MARPLRIEFADAIYHICARGNARQEIFTGESDRARLVDLLRHSARRFELAIIAFVLMENHFHLIAQTHRPNLSRWMQWLMATYTIFFNKRHRRSGHLFQGRYKSFLVEGGEYLLSLSRYVHLNPVRGVCLGKGNPIQRRKRLRAFKWSTYPGYAGLARPFDFIEHDLVFGEQGGPKHGAQARYRRFVEEGLLREIDSPFELVRWQTMLGSDSFVQNVRDRVKKFLSKPREVPALRALVQSAIDPGEILNKLAQKHQVDKRQILASNIRGIEARSLAMWLIWETGTKSLREIGEMFGGLDYAAVNQRIRRIRSNHSEEKKRQLLAEIFNVET